MAPLKSLTKKSSKHDRERKVLFGLIEYFIKTGKPVGSNTLKDVGFADLSSATIRNYFANLDEEGYLIQQHSSGGRVPTDKAFRLYASDSLDKSAMAEPKSKQFDYLKSADTRAVAPLLQKAAEQLAATTNAAVFLSAPRFDQDFIVGIKLVPIDTTRCLCVLITDFGEIKTEILYVDQKIGTLSSKRIEAYFNWRLNGQNKPEGLSNDEEEIAQKLYNELLVRYIVNYSPFNAGDVYRTGFSSLMAHPEFLEPTLLANSLAFFENTQTMRLILKECVKHNLVRFWIGNDLTTFSSQMNPDCTVIAVPYHVNNQPVGAVGILAPQRIQYPIVFDILRHFSYRISDALTRNLYKFKISFRTPDTRDSSFNKQILIADTKRPLLEDKRSTHHKASEQRKESTKTTPRRK